MRSQDAGEPSGLAPTTEVGKMVDHLFRNRAGQMVAYLARWLGPEHLDLAEEVVQEALLKALQHWPYNGVPQNPAGWLFRVARNAALDAVRRNILFSEKAPELVAEFDRGAIEAEPDDAVLESQLRDDELRMIFMCCHPTIPRDTRVALSLKTVGGFSSREIARAFLADEVTVAQRLFRAKRQVRDAGLRLDLPTGNELAQAWIRSSRSSTCCSMKVTRRIRVKTSYAGTSVTKGCAWVGSWPNLQQEPPRRMRWLH